MVAKTCLASASGILALLDEPAPEMKTFALTQLNECVDEFWAEISESIGKIESLFKDKGYTSNKLAALVASKVYYHLGSYEDALHFALGAMDYFDVNVDSEYVSTIITKCIDQYTARMKELYANPEAAPVDGRLESIVNRMFQKCLHDKQFKQAIGVAIEAHRVDIFQAAITGSENRSQIMDYAMKVTMTLVENRNYRNQLLRLLTQLFKDLSAIPDYVSMCQCLIFLDDSDSVIDILNKLISSDEDSILMSYQIAFDLYDSASQNFLTRIIEGIKAVSPDPSQILKKKDGKPGAPDATASATIKKELTPEEQVLQSIMEKIATILSGEKSIELELQFLIRNNRTDPLILKNTKDTVRNSVCHSATVIANGLCAAGTTDDHFLRDNLEWLSRAVNWAKFTATSSIGVIHKGHEKEALTLMQAYLPKDTAGQGNGYTEGGGLYALGLIHVNHGGTIIDYLLNQLKDSSNEPTRHGGCLGIGLAAMGTQRSDVYEQLKFHLIQDDAVTGEAAAIAMGLNMLGSNNTDVIEEMVSYAHETQHEKILRGLAIGIGMNVFGRLEEADSLIESLSLDKDPLIRRSGMHTIAMAYCGSGNNKAIRKLLHFAVSDVNDDVRRAAVEAIGFLLFRTPEQCPPVVSLLSESFNPHVRCGAAMALGICCAGTGSKAALDLLDPLMNDSINYVRQGALIASALICIQQTEAICPKVKELRASYIKTIGDKHEDVIAKFGAIIAQGIIDAGGRNVTISLLSRTGHINTPAVVGMLVFTQFWYWFPLAHFISLTFRSTAIIGLNAELDMPTMEFRSGAKPSTFGYPPPTEEKKEKVAEKVSTAVLSTTVKQKRKEAEKKEKEEKMDVDEPSKSPVPAAAAASASPDIKVEDKDKKPEEGIKKEEVVEKKKEPRFEMLQNPARVMKQQLRVISVPAASRYKPVKDLKYGGIILVKDTQADKPIVLVKPVAAGGPKVEEEAEPEPPQPFEYNEN